MSPNIIAEIRKIGKIWNLLSKNIPKIKKKTNGRATKKPSSNPKEIA